MLFSEFYLWHAGFSWFVLTCQLLIIQLWLSLIKFPELTKFLSVIPRNRPFRKHPLIPNHTSHSFCGNAAEVVQAPTPVVKRQHKPLKNMYIHLSLASAICDEVWTHLSCLQEMIDIGKDSYHLTEIPGITKNIPAQFCFSPSAVQFAAMKSQECQWWLILKVSEYLMCI